MLKVSSINSTTAQKGTQKKSIRGSQPRVVSFFEFWPTWVMYAPVALQWVVLSFRYRSLTLPFIANPKLTISGMVGVTKSELMSQAGPKCDAAILDWDVHTITDAPLPEQINAWLERLQGKGIHFPLVCKPDIGCRGSGVKLIHDVEQLYSVMAQYPLGANLLGQKLASWEPEVGIFYVKKPGNEKGEVVSLTIKYSPYVIGDGKSTLGELVDKDNRAKQLLEIYQHRHIDNWQQVIAKDEPYRLVFSASHCRGAVFEDACHHITPELTRAIDELMSDLPEFYYGRLDAKYSNLQDLKSGENIEVVEINAASAESIHIWDKNTTLFTAIKTLLWQYRTLFQIGHENRKKGYKTPGIKKILQHWLKERSLTKYYPDTD